MLQGRSALRPCKWDHPLNSESALLLMISNHLRSVTIRIAQ